MVSARALLHRASLALAVGWLPLVGAMAAADDIDLTVLKSTGPALNPGDRLAPDSRLSLSAGQAVTLITADGRVIALKGPYDGPAAKASGVKNASVTDMLQPLMKSKVDGATPGVVRAAGEVPPSRTPWVLDTSTSGDFCYLEGMRYDLYRPAAAGASDAVIEPAGGGTPLTVSFGATKTHAPFPASLPLADGSRYTITVDGKSVAITLHWVPKSVPLDRTAATWFAANHCDAQARALLRAM